MAVLLFRLQTSFRQHTTSDAFENCLNHHTKKSLTNHSAGLKKQVIDNIST